MNSNSQKATATGQLQKAKRKAVPIRMFVDEHSSLQKEALAEERSMSFIALRRYRKGLAIELAERGKS